MEIKNKKLFKELIKKLALEIMNETDDEIDEVTSTASAPGYSTPKAFVGKNKKKKNKKLKQSLKQVGYSIAEEIEYNLKLMIEDSKDKKEKKYKPGDVWERPSGDWAGKNSKGDIQGYGSKEDAESWAKGEVPKSKDSTKDEPESEKDAIDREEKEDLKKKATKGFFKSKWDDFGKQGVAGIIKKAKDKGEKVAQDLEKGDAPVDGPLNIAKDLERHKKGQSAAAKALRKKQAADAESERKKKEAEDKKKEKERQKKVKTDKKKSKVNKKKTKKKPVKKKPVKKKVKEELDSKDVSQVKKLIRQVVADILRDLWIKRSIWKDKR